MNRPFQILREVWKYMSIITSLSGVSYNDSKDAMKELLIFEGRLAMVGELTSVSDKDNRLSL